MKILFLGRLADAAGGRERMVNLPLGIADVDALRRWVGDEIPALLEPSVRAVINGTLAMPAQRVAEDDEIAFFPPVSGG